MSDFVKQVNNKSRTNGKKKKSIDRTFEKYNLAEKKEKILFPQLRAAAVSEPFMLM